MFLAAMSLVLAIGATDTGPLEKGVLAVALTLLLALVRPVHRIG